MKPNRLFLVLAFLPAFVCAQEQQIINYFSVGGNEVCLPVFVKHSRGSFSFSENNYRVDGPIDYVEAWDCQGRKILDTTPDKRSGISSDKTKPIVYEYIFSTLYPESQSTGEGEIEYTEEYGSNQPVYTDPWEKLMANVERGRRIYDPAYPNLTLQAGLSNVDGEYLRAKACLGGRVCYVLYGGVGRDWLFKANNADYIGPDAKKLAWHVGMGICGGDLNGETRKGEMAFLMDYARTPLVQNGSLNMMLQGTWYFGNRGHFGAFAGIGCSFGDFDAENPKIHFIFEVGLAYRFCRD